jgi:leader peptidase (prepilin peptidase)/N-methyltransferase
MLSWLVVLAALAGFAAGIAGRAAIRRWSAGREPAVGASDSCEPAAASEPGGPGRAASGTPAVRGPHLPPLLVETATAAVTALLAAAAGATAVLPALCWLGACAIPLAVIDVREHRLPDVLTAAAYVGTLVLLTGAAAAGGHWAQLGRAAAGGAAAAACFVVLALASPGSVGLGDVKLAASAGTALAWFGWRVLVAGVFAGLLLAAVFGVILLVVRRASLRQKIPFGPFLLAGTLAAVIAALPGSW